MDNSSPPSGGNPQDYWQTQEVGPAGARAWQPADLKGPGGVPGPPGAASGETPNQSASPGEQPGTTPRPPVPRQRHSRGLLWAAGLAVVAVLVGGSAFAVSQLAATTAAGPTGQAAQLNDMLNDASAPGSAADADNFAETAGNPPGSTATNRPCQARAAKLKTAGHPFAAERAQLLCRGRLARLRLVGGLHGQFTFRDKSGTTTLAYERGAISSVTGGKLVVRAADGTTMTWVLGSSTVVREGAKKVSSGTLSGGAHVFVAGPVAAGTRRARLIVIQASSASPSPAPSPAS